MQPSVDASDIMRRPSNPLDYRTRCDGRAPTGTTSQKGIDLRTLNLEADTGQLLSLMQRFAGTGAG